MPVQMHSKELQNFALLYKQQNNWKKIVRINF